MALEDFVGLRVEDILVGDGSFDCAHALNRSQQKLRRPVTEASTADERKLRQPTNEASIEAGRCSKFDLTLRRPLTDLRRSMSRSFVSP